MNKELKKLNLVKSEIETFMKTSPAFYLDLIKIINFCMDGYMLEKGFSLKIRNLFLILLEEDCDKIKINAKDYKLIKKQVNELMFNHLYCYYDFVELVKRHVRSGHNNIGYNKFARLLYGEPPISVHNNTPGFSQAFYVSEMLIEFTEQYDNALKNINEINTLLIKNFYSKACFTEN